MSAPKLSPHYTVEQYLKIERAAEDRHEYLDGRIFAVAGQSNEHGDISTNVVGLLHQQLRGTRCRARTKDTKVLSGPELKSDHVSRILFSYPDVVVICGEPKYHDEHRDIVLNPTAIVEVLSPSTEGFDRGEKFTRYQTWNPTLRDYVLVAQDRAQVEHFSRQADGGWAYHRHTGLTDSVTIPSISCTLKLADVFERIVFVEE